MDQLQVEFHPEAILEAREAREWYNERNQDVATAFMDELDAAIDDVADAPSRWPKYLYGTRQKLFYRFPYVLVYRERSDLIQVIAVAHGRRRPGYWKDRLKTED